MTTFLDELKSIAGDALTHYYELDDANKAKDLVGHLDGKVHGGVQFKPDGAHFDGKSWIELPDHADFSAATTKEFTQVHFFEVTDWKHQSHNGEYVHYMGKGAPHKHEWTCRYYIDGGGGEAAQRRRRTSFYVFNPDGGLGAGSYVQDADASAHERMMTGVIYAKGSGSHPGVSRQYQNGVKKDEDKLSGYNITPEHTSVPVGLGSRGDNTGFLVGRMRRVAFFKRALTDDQIKRIYDARNAANAGAGGGQTHPQPSGGSGDVVDISGAVSKIDGVDVDRKTDQLIAYTPKHGDSTGTNEFGTEVVVDGHSKITAVLPGKGDTPIPVGGVVLSGHGAARQWLNDHATVGAAVKLPESILSNPADHQSQPTVDPQPTRVDTGATARVDEARAIRSQATELRKTADALDVIAAHLDG